MLLRIGLVGFALLLIGADAIGAELSVRIEARGFAKGTEVMLKAGCLSVGAEGRTLTPSVGLGCDLGEPADAWAMNTSFAPSEGKLTVGKDGLRYTARGLPAGPCLIWAQV